MKGPKGIDLECRLFRKRTGLLKSPHFFYSNNVYIYLNVCLCETNRENTKRIFHCPINSKVVMIKHNAQVLQTTFINVNST